MGGMLALMSLSVLWLICHDVKISLGADDYKDGVGEYVVFGVSAHDGDLGDCLNLWN